MKDEIRNVLIAGVGGQGVLLVSEILAEVCMDAGYDVKKSEVHGMAQRGGSVVSHVRYGTKVYSPLIEMGTAHVLLALEELEALRWVNYLHPDAVVIVNRQQIKPLPVAVGLPEWWL
jgi:indolepyruvate ferredoxin oxidoreductase beta subunit